MDTDTKNDNRATLWRCTVSHDIYHRTYITWYITRGPELERMFMGCVWGFLIYNTCHKNDRYIYIYIYIYIYTYIYIYGMYIKICFAIIFIDIRNIHWYTIINIHWSTNDNKITSCLTRSCKSIILCQTCSNISF